MKTYQAKHIAKLMAQLPKENLEQEVYDLLMCCASSLDYKAIVADLENAPKEKRS